MTWFFFLLIVSGIVFYFTTRDERAWFFRVLRGIALAAWGGAVRWRADHDGFYDILRERTRIPFVTAGLILLNGAIYVRVLIGDGHASDAATLVSWGANFGPLTSNGEWWRLLASIFVHSSALELLLTVACLAQLGFMLERLAGHTAVAVVYLSAGALTGLVSLAVAPVAASAGSAGAVIGLYGLLMAVTFWSTVRPGAASIPWKVLRDFAPLAGILIIYQVFTGSTGGWVELAGFVSGLVAGLVLATDISESKPAARRIAVVTSAGMMLVLASTFPLRGITDARPEVERVIAAEAHATNVYREAVIRFNEGLVPATALTRVIERQILPEIRTMRTRLQALAGVPPEHQPMVTAAQEYLRLREESWRLRREGLQRTSMGTLGKADRTEWESLQAFKRIRSGA